MPLFQYRASDLSGKEVRGSIEAPTPDSAKRALEDIHLEDISVEEATRSEHADATAAAGPSRLQSVFAFEGTDATGNTRRGTIQAESKYEAFEQLRQQQGLYLTMLSPMGVTPKYKDHELLGWQPVRTAWPGGPEEPSNAFAQKTKGISVSPPLQSNAPQAFASPAAKPQQAPKKPIGFSGIPRQEPSKIVSPPTAPPPGLTATSGSYHPLTATLRLYGGWLLAWYGLFVALGYYSHNRVLSWNIPFVEAFYLSPLIFSFTVAIFLFLLLSDLHRRMRGGLIAGIGLGTLGMLLFLGVRVSV